MSEVDAIPPAKRGLFRKKAAVGRTTSAPTPSWDDEDDFWDESGDVARITETAEEPPQPAPAAAATSRPGPQRVRPKRSSADMFKQRSWEDSGWDDGGWDDEWSDPSLRVSVPSAASPRSDQVDAWLSNSADQGEITKDITVKWAGPDANRTPAPGATWDEDSEHPPAVAPESTDTHPPGSVATTEAPPVATTTVRASAVDATPAASVPRAPIIPLDDDDDWEDLAIDDDISDDLDDDDLDDTPSRPLVITTSAVDTPAATLSASVPSSAAELDAVRASLTAASPEPNWTATPDPSDTVQPEPVADSEPTVHPEPVADSEPTIHPDHGERTSVVAPDIAPGTPAEPRFAAFASLAPAAASVATTAGLGLALVAGGRTLLGLAEGASIARQGSFDALHRVGSVFSRIGSLQGLLILLAIAFVTLPLLVDDEAEDESASSAGIALGVCIVAALVAMVGAILAFRYDVKTHDLGSTGLTTSTWLRSGGELVAAGGSALVAFVAGVMALRARTSE